MRPKLTNLAYRALVMELRVYESLGRFIAQKPKIAPEATGFRYHRPVLTILIIFIVLSAVEIPIIDMIVHRWLPVRIGFLILGFWGLTWMLGLLFAYLTRPHTVGPTGITVREGLELEVLVPWSDFESIGLVHTVAPTGDPDNKPQRVFDEEGERICAIRIGNETNLEITFETPTVIKLPGLNPKGGSHQVTKLRFWADDPEALFAEARTHVARLNE